MSDAATAMSMSDTAHRIAPLGTTAWSRSIHARPRCRRIERNAASSTNTTLAIIRFTQGVRPARTGAARLQAANIHKRLARTFDLDRTPFEVLDRRHTAINFALGRSAEELSARRGESVTRRDVENGLVSVLGLEDIFDLLHRDIDTEEILALVGECDFARLRPETLCEIRLDESIVPEGVPLSLTEAEVKMKGEIWTIHKYDADPFPSNPHGHNYARALKLHLGNGDLYQNKSRVSCGRMAEKHLLKLRDLVLQKNATIALPCLEIGGR